MGRPLNKRYMGVGPGDQIKVRAKIGTNAEGDGYIVRQRTTSKYEVTVGANTGFCKLVNKANGALAAGEMTITVMDDDSQPKRVKKLLGRTASLFDGAAVTTAPWTFNAATDDGAAAAPAIADIAVITAQPADGEGIVTATVAFSVTATSDAAYPMTYQWQVSTDDGATFADMAGKTANSLSVTVSGPELDGNLYRCVVTTSVGSVTSEAALLTVTA